MTIREIEEKLKNLEKEEQKLYLETLKLDERAGVKKVVQKYQGLIQKEEALQQEAYFKAQFDEVYHQNQYQLVGIDEVGRGPLAGPVVAAAVILPQDSRILGLKDSKKLSEAKREELYKVIKAQAIAIGVGVVDAKRIDEINILQATFEAMRTALKYLNCSYDKILVDGDKTIPGIAVKQEAIIGGDDKSASIAAASIIAKVTRDQMMKKYAKEYPEYKWEQNKGYGSAAHYEAINQYGITKLHRKSFL